MWTFLKAFLILICLLIISAFALLGAGIVSFESGNRAGRHRDAEIEKLQTLGYMGGYRPPSEEDQGIPATKAGTEGTYTLVTSGHAPAAFLLDASGTAIHTWSMPFRRVFPEYHIGNKNKNRDPITYWRHATLLSGGELLVIFEGVGIVKLDRDSNILWSRLNGAHHDLKVLSDGTIIVLTRRVEEIANVPALVDYVSYLDATGTEKKKISLVKALFDLPFGKELLKEKNIEGDFLHSNSVQVLDSKAVTRLPVARSGDLLISLRNINTIAILDPETEKFIWTSQGAFKMQHYAHVDWRGKTLWLFDNLGARKESRVLQYEWPSMKLLKRIGAPELHTSFFSKSLGVVEALPNGNVLIAESEGGRLFELNDFGQIMWKYSSPYRTGVDNKLIATIPHVHRISAGQVTTWLQKKPG